jgi:hypothetical protein
MSISKRTPKRASSRSGVKRGDDDDDEDGDA